MNLLAARERLVLGKPHIPFTRRTRKGAGILQGKCENFSTATQRNPSRLRRPRSGASRPRIQKHHPEQQMKSDKNHGRLNRGSSR